MKIIFGLGNPTKEYVHTRHNVGFMFLDYMADVLHFSNWQKKLDAAISEGFIAREKVLLIKPLTFMNESGRAVAPILSWYKLSTGDFSVVYDDMDLEAGKIRIRKKGSAGGHNGMKSILYQVKSEEFARFRIGIGRPKPFKTVIEHVLEPFSAEEYIKIKEAFTILVPAIECMVTYDIDLAMNRFNPRKKQH